MLSQLLKGLIKIYEKLLSNNLTKIFPIKFELVKNWAETVPENSRAISFLIVIYAP